MEGLGKQQTECLGQVLRLSMLSPQLGRALVLAWCWGQLAGAAAVWPCGCPSGSEMRLATRPPMSKSGNGGDS